MNKRIHIFLCFLVSVLVACEQTSMVDLNPGNTIKLNVAGFVGTGDSVHYFLVSRSSPVFGVYEMVSDTIKNAKVKLDDGSQQVTLTYDSLNNAYANQDQLFFIRAGKPVNVTVEHEGMIVSAISTPPTPADATVHFAVDSFPENGLMSFIIKATVHYKGAKAGYIRVNGFVEDGLFSRVGLVESKGIEVILAQPGETYHFEYKINGNYFPDTQFGLVAQLYLLQCSSEYYNYYESLRRRSIFSQVGDANLVYSNINNGIGIFAAYTVINKQQLKIR